MRRRLINLLTLLSLLLCVAVAALWVRSYWVSDEIRCGRMHDPATIVWWNGYSAGGTVGVSRTTITFAGGMAPDSIADWSSRGVRVDWAHTVPGVTLLANLMVGWIEESFTDTRRVDSVTLQIPYWMVAALVSAVPGIRYLAGVRRRRRRAAACCRCCGYDLRATPGRCPECGHTPSGAAA